MNRHRAYAINMITRAERRCHTEEQFRDRDEFTLKIINPVSHIHGTISLWETIRSIVELSILKQDKYIIICEDDHLFTDAYHKIILENSIRQADNLGADVLLGGVSWFNDALQISDNLFWIHKFSGLQFTIVFERFFEQILQSTFTEFDAADDKISRLSNNKLAIYPFISTQKEFGYSDLTPKNNIKGRVSEIFQDSLEKLGHLDKVKKYYELNTII